MVKEGYKQTEVGVIPEDWELKSVESIGHLFSGESPSKLKDGKIPYYKVDQLNNSIKYQNQTPYHVCTEHPVPAGSIVFPKRGAAIATNKIRILVQDSYFDTNIMSITVDNNQAEAEYLYYLLVRKGLWEIADTTSIPQINNKHINPLIFPFPDKEEQRRIAKALSDIDELISSLEKLIAKKTAIKQGAMQQLLTGKTSLNYPSLGWEGVRLGDVVNTSSGGTPSREIVRYYEGNIPWITTSELNDCRIYDSIEHITNEAIKNSSAKMFPAGTILMAMYGATIGKLGILEIESTTNQACCAMMCTSRVFNLYLYYYLLSIRDEIISLGSGAGQPNISQQIVKNLPLKLPKYEEQVEIGSVLHDIDTEIDNLELKMKKQQQIKQGIMQQLLTGKIRLV